MKPLLPVGVTLYITKTAALRVRGNENIVTFFLSLENQCDNLNSTHAKNDVTDTSAADLNGTHHI